MGNAFGLIIVRPLGLILLAIFKAVHSYGLAVILFALAVKLVCIPLAIKGKKSMLAMTALNNEMQQIQKTYANNRAKLNEEMQKLYDKHGVNPMSGCLPQFIPLPIMMGLYYAVQQPLKFMMGFGDEVIAKLAALVGVDTATAGFYSQITIAEKLSQMTDAAGNFPTSVTSITDGMGELLKIDFSFLGLDLSQVPSIRHPGMIWVIPLLSGLTAYLSSFIIQRMQGTQNNQAANTMKSMYIIMPLMSVYFGFVFPGAIGIYWIFNNVFTCVQEVVLTKLLRGKRDKEEAEKAAKEAAAKEARREANRAAQQQSQGAKKKKGDK